MTFQAWKKNLLDSMTFQVFHILYEPCPDWHGIPPPAASGSRRRVHKDQGWDSQHCILSTACVHMSNESTCTSIYTYATNKQLNTTYKKTFPLEVD